MQEAETFPDKAFSRLITLGVITEDRENCEDSEDNQNALWSVTDSWRVKEMSNYSDVERPEVRTAWDTFYYGMALQLVSEEPPLLRCRAKQFVVESHHLLSGFCFTEMPK